MILHAFAGCKTAFKITHDHEGAMLFTPLVELHMAQEQLYLQRN